MNKVSSLLLGLCAAAFFSGCGETEKETAADFTVKTKSGVTAQADAVVTSVKKEAAAPKTTISETDSTVTVTVTAEKPQPASIPQIKVKPLKIAVFDFSCTDLIGQKLISHRGEKVNESPQETLNDKDRRSMNSVMQGLVRIVDAIDGAIARQTNRETVVADNNRDYEAKAAVYKKVMEGQSRPVVIGAEYMSGYLGAHPDLFQSVDRKNLEDALVKVESDRKGASDVHALRKFATASGATHLLYGTAADMKTQSKKFKGYGIETQSTEYSLDVIVKLVDLQRQKTVFSRVFTGNSKEMQTENVSTVNDATFNDLMKSALESAAETLYECAKADYATWVPPIHTLTFSAVGTDHPEAVRVLIDGVHRGMCGEPIAVTAGFHDFILKAPGMSDKTLQLDVTDSADITVQIKK